MYPERELTRLADLKAGLRRRIGLHRAECAEAAAGLAVPIEWLDRVLGFLRMIKPLAMLAAVPIGALVARSERRPLRWLSSISRWAPLIFGAMGSD
jgi:hypothetical protein